MAKPPDWPDPKLYFAIDYEPSTTTPQLHGDHIFKYCTFEQLREEDIPICIEATFLSCTFSNTVFYWSLFNEVLFF